MASKQPKRRFSPEPLARWCATHRAATFLAWAVVVVVAFFLTATLLSDATTTEFDFTAEPDSKKGQKLLEERLRGPRGSNEVVVIQSAQGLTVDSVEFQGFTEGLYAALAGAKFKNDDSRSAIEPGTFQNYYQNPGAQGFLVNEDRTVTIMPLVMAGDFDDASDNISPMLEIVGEAHADERFDVYMVGQASASTDFRKLANEGLKQGEIFGAPIAVVILLAALGTLVAALLPIVLAAVSIVVALGASALMGQVFELAFLIQNMVTMIGLAVGIDYSLFILTRYREERRKGLEKVDAIGRASATATRAVVFSGFTVVVALAGMLLVPSNVFVAIGMGMIFVVVASVLATMTLLPAILGTLGDNVDRLAIPWIGKFQTRFDETREGGFWDKISKGVMAQPLLSLVLAGGLLIAAAVSFFDINTGTSGIQSLPDVMQSKQGFLVLDSEFTSGEATPAEIVIDGDIGSPEIQAGVAALAGLLEQDSTVIRQGQLEVNSEGNLAVLAVFLNGDSSSDEALDAVVRIRKDHIPTAFGDNAGKVYVTGQTALNVDFYNLADNASKVVFPFVLGISFVLLTVVFRSIVIAIKAIILNMISVGATYGLLVLVFQKGVWNEAFGFHQTDTIEAWIPIFLFAVLFGLSMDYHVFLLSRIRERYDETQDNEGSVAFGIRSTGRLITAAALIMVTVFWGFAAGDVVGLQQMGFGLGVAVLLDASIVRMVLAPAGMKLLGRWNWYLPSWLSWLPDLRVERSEQPASAAAD